MTNTSTTATPNQEQIRAAWDAIAPGYDAFVTDIEVWLANEALKRADVRKGVQFLDVAAGAGGLSLPAARLGATVLATDWSPAMIERLTARAQREGLSNVAGRVMDCHALDLEDETFDVTGSQFGVMLVPDQPVALREMCRVTKAGGRVLVVAYGSPEELEFLHFFVASLQAVDPAFTGVPMNPRPLEFQVSDPAVLRERLAHAGAREITISTVIEKLEFRSGEEMWNCVMNGNPIAGRLTAGLTDRQRADARRVLDGLLRERSGGSGPAVLTNPVHIAVGAV
jgi:ubiquinone/menaquinone biosynthesis C-methylase UbiE